MAHRSNVIQVAKTFEARDLPETVIDPVCGMKLERRTCRYVLVRGEEPVYFCSKECQLAFMDPKSKAG